VKSINNKLRVSENKVLRKAFGHKRDESGKQFRIMKSRLWLAGDVAQIGGDRNSEFW
jgi:hypothetical protein